MSAQMSAQIEIKKRVISPAFLARSQKMKFGRGVGLKIKMNDVREVVSLKIGKDHSSFVKNMLTIHEA